MVRLVAAHAEGRRAGIQPRLELEPVGQRVGAVVVWPNHVGIITGRAANGQWIVKSGNDGGMVRERPRSVAGAVFRI